MDDDKVVEEVIIDSAYYGKTIQELTDIMLSTSDPKVIEACGKAIDSIGKRKLEEEKSVTDIELAIETNDLKAKELDIQESKIASENKGNWLHFWGGVLAVVGPVLGVVINGQNATAYLQKYKDIENNGTLINTSRSMIPNIFTRNK